VRVAAEVEVLHRESSGLVLLDQVAHARVDVGEAPFERDPGPRLDHAAVEGGQAAPVREHDAVPGVGCARVYAEDDH
jgi:hypothetical protein